MNKAILVLSDGLYYETAVASMGYLGHLVEVKLASLTQANGLFLSGYINLHSRYLLFQVGVVHILRRIFFHVSYF